MSHKSSFINPSSRPYKSLSCLRLSPLTVYHLGISFLSLLICSGLLSCGPEPIQGDNRGTSTLEGPSAAERKNDDFGEDWVEASLRSEQDASSARPGEGRGTDPYWSILLRTFDEGDHELAARTMVQSVASINPRLARAHVHTTREGSSVLFGRYDEATGQAAQKDLEWIKSLKIQNAILFPRAMLTHITPPRSTFGQFELLGVRQLYPDVAPLYTLQIAVWGDFGGGELTSPQIRRRAEAYVRQLRGQGVPAFYHHDGEKKLSMVTVGVFDSSAIDPQTGFFSWEVEQLMERFPEHLVNGEPLLEPIDRKRPGHGTRVQTPRLVLVPEL